MSAPIPHFRNELLSAIDQAEIVSFDIFDTLIVRCYEKPTDLFRHIEQSLNRGNFAELRMGAEKNARHKARAEQRQETTLDEIYAELPVHWQYLKQIEIDQELASCSRDAVMFEFYNYALTRNKKILLASDMYLPIEVVSRIVGNAGYGGYEKILLSSQTGRQKATGALFDDIIEAANVSSDKILHIGDNSLGDYHMAQQRGLKAFLYIPAVETFGAIAEAPLFRTLDEKPYSASIVTSLLKGLVFQYNMRNANPDYWKKFGFVYGGLLAYGFCVWIKEQCDREKITDIYFAARDGFLFKKVFDQLYPGLKTHYLYASRRCYLLANSKEVDADFLYHVAHKNTIEGNLGYWTVRDFMTQLALESKSIKDAYINEFPNQEEVVRQPEQLEKIKNFFRFHEDELVREGEKEREILIDYFAANGMFGKKIAIVDLGWKGTLVKKIRNIGKRAGRKINLIGLYLATHKFDPEGVAIKSYALDQRKPNNILNTDIAAALSELIFSAPHPSIVKLKRNGSGFEPLYQDETSQAQITIEIYNKVEQGLLAFIQDFGSVTKKLPLSICGQVSIGALTAICNNLQAQDRRQIEKTTFVGGIGNAQKRDPILKPVKQNCFAITSSWPGDVCGEYEILARLKKAAENIGAEAILISDNGYILNQKQQRTGNVVDIKSLQFVISIHYATPKLLDCFYYYTIWNPPEIPLGVPAYYRAAQNYLMYDDYLLNPNGHRMFHHLSSVLVNSPRQLENASPLFTSFPADALLSPNLKDPMLFYCGMNWEKFVYGSKHRHEDVLQLLDKTGRAKFFGPIKTPSWGNVRSWDGFESYRGEIPFDGFSILKEINECGVVLVISSDDHRRSGMATNRLYEAIAGGAVIISDDNPFVVEHFHDAALFIEYNVQDPADTFRQIMEKLEWIKANLDQATALVLRAQQIFKEKFSLEKQLQDILDNHTQRQQAVANALYARNADETVLAIYVMDQPFFDQIQKQKLTTILDNVERQLFTGITLAIECDHKIKHLIENFCRGRPAKVQIYSFVIYNKKGTRILTDGNIYCDLKKRILHDYLIFMGPQEYWYRDHITTLKRVLEDQVNAVAAYPGRTYLKKNNSFTWNTFNQIDINDLFECKDVLSGEVLFKREVEDYLEPYVFDFLEGTEHYAFLLFAEFKHKKTIAFSKRMTFAYAAHLPGKADPSVKRACQTRLLQDMVHYEYDYLRCRETTMPFSLLPENQRTSQNLSRSGKIKQWVVRCGRTVKSWKSNIKDWWSGKIKSAGGKRSYDGFM